MSEADWKGLYDLSNESSGYARSVAAADGVWCTNWNAFTDAQMSAEVLDAWGAPFETHATFTTKARTPEVTPGPRDSHGAARLHSAYIVMSVAAANERRCASLYCGWRTST